MSVKQFIKETAKLLSFKDAAESLPEAGNEVELMLPAEREDVKSYMELDFVRGVYTLHSSIFGPLPPIICDLLPYMEPAVRELYGHVLPVVLVNPKLDVTETKGVLLITKQQLMFWRSAELSALPAPKVKQFANADTLPT
jgi:hypothetical protein